MSRRPPYVCVYGDVLNMNENTHLDETFSFTLTFPAATTWPSLHWACDIATAFVESHTQICSSHTFAAENDVFSGPKYVRTIFSPVYANET